MSVTSVGIQYDPLHFTMMTCCSRVPSSCSVMASSAGTLIFDALLLNDYVNSLLSEQLAAAAAVFEFKSSSL